MATNTEPKWYLDMLAHAPAGPKPVLTTTAENNIVLYAQGDEMLRVAEDGFYVRGVKLEKDDKEAEEVYNAFKQWLAWSVLNNQQ